MRPNLAHPALLWGYFATVAALVLGCARAPQNDAALAGDRSVLSGNLYGSATDDRDLPRVPADECVARVGPQEPPR